MKQIDKYKLQSRLISADQNKWHANQAEEHYESNYKTKEWSAETFPIDFSVILIKISLFIKSVLFPTF